MQVNEIIINIKNKIRNILLHISGTSITLINECPESEVIKYVGIAILIINTAFFAGWAGWYTYSSIFGDDILAVCFGIFWGFVIFSIDRFLVSQMRKTGVFSKDFKSVLPRLFLAGIIAFSIARPIELRLFSSEIENELNEILLSTLKSREEYFNSQSKLADQDYKTKMQEIDREAEILNGSIKDLRAQETNINTDLTKAYNDYLCERNGTCGTNRRGYGTHAQNKLNEYLSLKSKSDNKLQAIDSILLRKQNELDLLLTKRQEKSQVLYFQRNEKQQSLQEKKKNALKETSKIYSRSFLARSNALSKLSKENIGIKIVSIFLTLLFFTLEFIPVFSKMISEPGKYDFLLGKEREKARTDFEISVMQMKMLRQHSERIFTTILESGKDAEIEKIQKLYTDWKNSNFNPEGLTESLDKHLKEIIEYSVMPNDLNKNEKRTSKVEPERVEVSDYTDYKESIYKWLKRDISLPSWFWWVTTTGIVAVAFPMLFISYFDLAKGEAINCGIGTAALYATLISTVFKYPPFLFNKLSKKITRSDQDGSK